jgi:hypothetical protein
MNDPRYPYHCISNADTFGQEPSPLVKTLPRLEEDFRTIHEATDWLQENRGGVIERLDEAGEYKFLARIAYQPRINRGFLAED